jgi:hypothetical protein
VFLRRPLSARPMVHPRGHEPPTVRSYFRRLVSPNIHPKWHVQLDPQLFNIRLQRIIDLVLGIAFPPAKVQAFVSAMEQNMLAQTIAAPKLEVNFVKNFARKMGE